MTIGNLRRVIFRALDEGYWIIDRYFCVPPLIPCIRIEVHDIESALIEVTYMGGNPHRDKSEKYDHRDHPPPGPGWRLCDNQDFHVTMWMRPALGDVREFIQHWEEIEARGREPAAEQNQTAIEAKGETEDIFAALETERPITITQGEERPKAKRKRAKPIGGGVRATSSLDG